MSHGVAFPLAFLGPFLGPFIIFMGHFAYLLPFYFTLNALILGNRQEAEWIMRSALLKSMVISGVAEIFWSTLCWQLSHRSCGILTLAAAFLQSLQMFCAFFGPYDALGAFALQCATQLLMIPVAQIGAQHTLKQGISPARYKIIAWLLSVVLAIVLLLFPNLVCFWLVLPCVVLPYTMLGILLTARSFPTATKPQSASKTSSGASNGVSAVSATAAAGFGVLGLLSGTIGEALTDSATTLALRSELKAGNSELALANHVTVLSSMSLAFWTQSKSERSTQKQVLCMLLWAGCQVFRIAALPYLGKQDTGQSRFVALAAMVFLDKYTGPLGSASLDSALLAVLYHGRCNKGLPETVLWTMRTAVARMERPICQLIMLHASLDVETLSLIFTFMTSVGVLAVLQLYDGRTKVD
ncbi:unnamed protein product [Cladocopium goreaui]|uniref:Uncharacterized protein n=1 Tax=Cladocopium goreaui TaxID=2562237 RepID=A0A9P1BLM0_9DINO|nr:unnamed protein product [Cladocopium goreaui]